MTDAPRSFADVTTLGVGGPIRELVEAHSNAEILATATRAEETGQPLLPLGGGSNILASDEFFDGIVLAIRTRGIDCSIDQTRNSARPVRLTVAAGENWDHLVAWTVDQGYAGLEALSGIPGSVGAAPIQNIGAYGQEVSEVISAVEVYDVDRGEVRRLMPAELEFSYRDSVFKHGLDAIVLSVEFDLRDAREDRKSQPLAFAQLAESLSLELGARVDLATVRESVLALRRAKGMLLDPADSDTRSVGSFFVNPIVTERFARSLPTDAPRFPLGEEASDRVLEIGAEVPPLENPGMVKLSAAWLIEHAGVMKGFALPGSDAAVSRKHTLALCNRGHARAEDIAALARYVRSLVQSQFGILLQPEPLLLGVDL